jgi:hypothetical protein
MIGLLQQHIELLQFRTLMYKNHREQRFNVW